MNEQITMLLCVAAGGAIGAVLRCLVGTYFEGPGHFPWNTFIVNFLGCFLISVIFFSMGGIISPNVKAFLFIGLFGAFTTMSSFSLETINLYVSGAVGLAIGNFLMNTVVCLGAGILGRWIGLLFV